MDVKADPDGRRKAMSSRITLRLIVDLPDEAPALSFENTVQVKIAAFGKVKASETKRYWKISELFEIFFSLQPEMHPELAYESILSSLGAGWEHHEISDKEQRAVCNPGKGSTFFSPYVRWANLERFPESAIVSP